MMTKVEQEKWKKKIDRMSQYECARLQRFAEIGHPIFYSPNDLYEYFGKHFKKVGGMTPTISKALGW